MINQPSDDEIDFTVLDITVGKVMGELFELQHDHPLVSFMGMSDRNESMRHYDNVIKSFNRDTSRLPKEKIELVETLGRYLDALRGAIDDVRSRILH